MILKQKGKSLFGLIVATVFVFADGKVSAQSTITNDGSLKAGAIPVNNGIYTIDGNNIGAISGKNLFFSFTQFGVGKGDTAQFSCTACDVNGATPGLGQIANIISRVTGPNQSSINGTINYHADINGKIDDNIQNANFWFFNPNGVVFGQGAVVNVPAELHIGSASQLKFKEGATETTFDTKSSTLSAGNPSSFGFLNTDAGNITIENGAILSAGEGAKSLTLSAANNLSNNSVINGDATAGNVLINNVQGGTVDTSIKITGNAIAGTTLINRGVIGGDATATSKDLNNEGIINGNAKAAANLFNRGTVAGNVKVTNNDLFNKGTIEKSATVVLGNVNNDGLINGNASAGKAIINNTNSLVVDTDIKITGNALAGTAIINRGAIGGNATATHADINNDGVIDGDATAAAILFNRGTISGNATATNDDLVNNGTIAKSATASVGNLSNLGIIGGNAKAGKALINNPKVDFVDTKIKIIGDATAGTSLFNRGTIEGNATATKNDLINSGNIAKSATAVLGNLNNDGTIDGNAEAGKALTNNTKVLVNTDIKITGNATAGTTLTNRGTLLGKAGAGTDLYNSGSIGDTAVAANNLKNDGTILGDATATNGFLANNTQANFDSNIKITGNAIAATALTNRGIIEGSATTTQNDLTNTGQITKSASAGNDLYNSGTIGDTAVATNNLKNDGTILGDATATNGFLANNGTIEGNATAGKDLTNNTNLLVNTGIKITGNATAGTTLTNRGTVEGNATTTKNDLTNSGKIAKSAVAVSGNLINDGTIGDNATAGATLTNRGVIGGKATSGTEKIALAFAEQAIQAGITNEAGATIGNGAETKNGADIDNAGTITGEIVAGNNLNNSGLIQTSHVFVGNEINLNGGTIESGTGQIGNDLLLEAKAINLIAAHIRANGAVDIRPSGYSYSPSGDNNDADKNPTLINFLSNSSIWAHNNLGVQHTSNVDNSGLPDFMKDKTVYYTINFNGSYGNIIGSETSSVSLTPENFRAFNLDPTIITILKSPTEETSWQPLPLNNLLINAFERQQVQKEKPDNPGNVVTGTRSNVNTPLNIPQTLSTPCGRGSSLAIKSTHGVILQFDRLLPFSVVSDDEERRAQKTEELNLVMENSGLPILANLSDKLVTCKKG